MSVKIIALPDLGEGVTEGEILKIHVKAGDSIAMDQALVEVMTDKASMEVPSSIEGLLESVEVSEGDMVSVGGPLFKVKTQGASPSDQKSKEPETSKNAGPDKKPLKTELSTDSKASQKEEPPQTKESPQPEKPDLQELISPKESRSGLGQGSDFVLALPSTRKLAQDLGLNLQEISQKIGSKQLQRSDLLDYVKKLLKSRTKAPIASPAKPDKNFEITKKEAIRGVKRLMFDSMTLSKATIPHFTVCEELPADHLIQLRTELKNRMQKQGLKVGYLPFFVKALIPVIQEFPLFNSVYDPESKEILFKKNLNVGFAVDSPQGLLVPVIKNLESKSLLEIIKKVFELSNKCREDRIQREELQGAGITITNLGSLGGISGTPIIQPPQMSILGIYKMRPQVIKKSEGKFEESSFITLSLTCDHRFIDGATATRFLTRLCQNIQEPSLLLL